MKQNELMEASKEIFLQAYRELLLHVSNKLNIARYHLDQWSQTCGPRTSGKMNILKEY
jgi:hypothetical protein